MAKPIINQVTHIPPLSIVNKYDRYLPTAFDESLTLVQKVNKVIENMRLISEISSDVVDQWNEVMKWMLNEGLSLALIAQLDVMLKDGSFENIINEQILGRKASIVVSELEPDSPDNHLFWYRDLGNVSIGFNPDGMEVSNAVVADNDPGIIDNDLWFDIL